MITLIYRGILALLIFTTVWIIFSEEKIPNQAIGALVLIPLVLRFLMIK